MSAPNDVLSRLRFRTNLDEAQTHLRVLDESPPPYVPELGSKLLFHMHNGREFELEVVAVMWDAQNETTIVELHIPRYLSWSVRQWTDHMKKLQKAEPMT